MLGDQNLEEMLNDDDDIWNSDNFIATVEVSLQKAEQERAVKHGTQSVVPSASANFPAASHSNYGRLSAYDPYSIDSRLAYGSSVSRGGFSTRVGDFAKVGPNISVQDTANRAPVFTPLNYQNPWTVSDVRDVYASQHLPRGGHNQDGHVQSSVVEDDSPVLRDLLAEKEGAISLLRTRLSQAEQQVEELRKKFGSHSDPQLATIQQRELERLSSQLLFKEHEISEIQRARLDKEEKLNHALAETASLREELEHLRQSRLTGAEGSKRPRDEGGDPQDTAAERHGAVTQLPHANIENKARTLEQRHDPWASPWVAERTLDATQRMTSHGGNQKISRTASEPGPRIPATSFSPAVATLKSRTAENDCVSSGKNHQIEKLEVNESGEREATAKVKEPETEEGALVRGCSTGISELSYSLQQIWGYKGSKDDGKALVAKLYASCAQDLYILLSNAEPKESIDGKYMQRREFESPTVSEKFHRCISKVTNGVAHPEVILGPLLEFCNSDNAKSIGSALKVLHCILQHDTTCRHRLVGRGMRKSYDPHGPSINLPYVERKKNNAEAQSGFRIVTKTLADGQSSQVPVFSSPRLHIRSKQEMGPARGITSRGDAVDKFKRQVSANKPRSLDQEQGQELQHVEVGDIEARSLGEGPLGRHPSSKSEEDVGAEKSGISYRDQSVGLQQNESELGGTDKTIFTFDDLDPFLKWMLHLALTSTSSIVRMEAVSIIGVLLVHSEPFIERKMFGALLYHQGLYALLKESAGIEIQLQSARIVHHLLHCPALFKTFCTRSEDQFSVPNERKDGGNVTNFTDGHQPGHTVDCGGEASAMPRESVCPPQAGLLKIKLLAGLSECLKFTGSSAKGYALRRSVMRLITFITSCGDSGVAFLMQPVTPWKYGADETMKTSKEDLKADGIAIGESASGQHIAGEISVVKGRDAGGRISGIDDFKAESSDTHDDQTIINIPEKLVILLSSELNVHDEEGESDAGLAEERACLIREVATLLSCLASHSLQSEVVLSYLTSSSKIARLTVSVTNDLICRRSLSQPSGVGRKRAGTPSSEIAELSKSLRRRVLMAMAEVTEPHL